MRDNPASRREDRKLNQRSKLLIALAAGALAVTMLVGYLIWSGYKDTLTAAEATTRGYAAVLEARLRATLHHADADLQQLASEIPPAALSPDAATRYPSINASLKASLAHLPEVASLWIFDVNGDPLYSTNDSATRPNISDRNHFQVLRNDPGAQVVFSEVLVARSTGKPGIMIARALRDQQGTFRGAAVAAIELDQLQKLFQTIGVGLQGNVAIYRRDDFRQVLRWPENKDRLNVPLPPDAPVRTILGSGAKVASAGFTATADGVRRVYSFHVLDPYPFFVAVGIAHNDVLAGWKRRSILAGFTTVALLGLLTGLLIRLSRTAAERAGLGAIVDASADAIVSRDTSGSVLTWNQGAEKLFGYTAAEMKGRPISVLTPPEREHELRVGDEQSSDFQPRTHDTVRLAKDGRRIAVSVSAAPIKDAAGRVNAVAIIFRDITEQKQSEEARGRLAAVTESSNDAIYLRDAEGRILYWNDSASRMYGYTAAEVIGRDSTFMVPPELIGQYEQIRQGLQRGEALANHETVRVRKDGTRIDVSISVSHVRNGDGQVIGSAVIARDITEHKQSTRDHAQLAAIVQSSKDAIVGRAPDDTIISWNAAAERMFGWTAQEALGKSFRRLLSRTPDVRRNSRFEKVLQGEDAPPTREDIRLRKDGSHIHVEMSMSAVKDEHGKVLFVSCIMRDVTERLQAERHIQQLATKDTLTGLSNRSMLMEQMNAAIVRAAHSNTQLAVMFIDLDRFKAVNDTLGHAAGDDLLRECAKRLLDCVRVLDVVARLGGDEFVVLLTDLTDTAIVPTISERMLELLTMPFNLRGQEAQISASIGICFYPADGTDVPTLMKNADIAMYHAKDQNRNNYQYYAEEMNQRRLQRAQLERELRAAVENDQFVLHFQPQISVATGEIQGVESLVRWQHPTRGLLAPTEFVSIAEETGLILPIGEWVLNHACETIKAWRANGVGVPHIVVNVSAGQLHEGLVDAVRQVMVKHGIEASWLMLEITETMLMERVEEAISILRRIRELGIRIAMDDFGTGYSSLSVLQRLPLDMLKIDRSFVSAIDNEADNARAVAIIGAIIAIAKELGLSVVAEGVDSPTQLAFLRTLNCDTYQGYLYSMPVDTQSLAVRYAAPVKSVLEDESGRAISMTTKVTMELLLDAQNK